MNIDRDWRIFEFIENFIFEHGYSPSSREIMQAVSVSARELIISLRRLRKIGAIDY